MRIATYWTFSSAGLEHLPYKQRVGGSNPSTSTMSNLLHAGLFFARRATAAPPALLGSPAKSGGAMQKV